MVLFITRKYPPKVGGMENFSAGLTKALAGDCFVLPLRHSQVHLLWWLPYVVLKGIWVSRRVDSIHIGDGVLAWLGVFLHWLTKKPISITVHGLDLTYNKYGYQQYIWWGLKRYSAIVAVSKNTAHILSTHGIPESTTFTISNGVDMQEWDIPRSKKPLEKLIQNIPVDSSFIMLTVGRLIKRKGVAWFVEKVMPQLPKNVIYIIVGSGPEQQHIQQLITSLHLDTRAYMLGRVDEHTLKALYGAADVFVMPNIQIANDVEGFGIVAIEAGASGLPVLAAKVEGMQDILVDGSTGLLIQSEDAEAWKQAIYEAVNNGSYDSERIISITKQKFSWETVARQYQNMFNILTK